MQSSLSYHPRIFLLLSAIAYTLPFIVAPYCWWLLFLLPPFLLFSLYPNALSWHEYLAWSLAISTIHLFPLGTAIICMTSAPLFLQLLPIILLIIYVGLHPFLFLLGIRSIFHRSKLSPPTKLLVWILGFWAYLLYIDYALFWPFGRWEGYLFMNPLLPLTNSPYLLAPLHWIRLPAMMFLYCVTTCALYWGCIQQRTLRSLLLFLCILVWLLPRYLVPSCENPPPWIQQMGCLPMILPKTMPLERGSILIAHEIQQCATQHPELRLIVLPESSWNGLPLNAINTLPAFEKLPIAHVLIGSFSLLNGVHHNSLYWFKNGQLQGRFDKCHAVPFIERIPWGGHWVSKPLFFKNDDPIAPSSTQKSSILIGNDILLIPYICSELFCNNSPYDPACRCPILAICNDWWFSSRSFRRRMLMGAQLRAIQWNRPIIYLSFYYAHYIDPYGIIHSLNPEQQDHFL